MAKLSLTRGPAMALQRAGQSAVRLADGRVAIIGGTIPFTGDCPMACVPPPTATIEIYDPKTGRFRSGGSLTEPRTGAAALLLKDGRVLVYGGQFDSTVEIYDPTTRVSARVKPPADGSALPTYATVVLLRNGNVLIAGGTYDDDQSTSDITLIFDPARGRFNRGPLLAKPRQDASAVLLADGRVLIVGGQHFNAYVGSANGDAELVDPSNPLSQSRLLHPDGNAAFGPTAKAVLLSDGRVLVAGGGRYDDDCGCMDPDLAQVFDPDTGTFAATGPMHTPRSGSAMVRIEDGRVLVFGGTDGSGARLATVEAFDPDSATFQVVADKFPLLSDFSLNELLDGRVLIAGGDNGEWSGQASSTWLLVPR